ncbi:DNA cytosine methyltransferase [Paludisphaera mucosa]|uniref:Cytosine-specific methyltransferase n=1 Tax=Paludisphaera mucosa TaxID=3030827 RepID=A0ABT6FGB5_9BACT|nr:DNA cytosine methyltransferase [Paludisphaera mucosa]MDG3006623.1 DNA cytosine methyltransferase [Paludisphaera mucosa]
MTETADAMRKLAGRPTAVELFAGAGLLSSAFAAEGFRFSLAVEQNVIAAETYKRNLGPHIRVGDVQEIEAVGACDVLVAGPPCQGFSTLGKRHAHDPRNKLSLEIGRWAKALSPKIVVVENVPKFLESIYWSELRNYLEGLGYDVETHVLNAADYGLPQIRRRCFAFASRIGLPTIPSAGGFRPSTVRQAWEGLPSEPTGRDGHVAPCPSPIALARMKVIPPGGDKRDVLNRAPHLAPKSWWTTRVQATDVWGRMHWDEPSNTLRTALLNASKGRYIHPEQDRVMTLREAARLQTIPDDWTFVGTPYQVARQIGNGVPPKLGRIVARSVRETL